MRVRSEWLTLFTVTTLAGGALFVHRGTPPEPAAPTRPEVAASGIDFTPVGAIRPLTNPNPAAKAAKSRAKPAARHP